MDYNKYKRIKERRDKLKKRGLTSKNKESIRKALLENKYKIKRG